MSKKRFIPTKALVDLDRLNKVLFQVGTIRAVQLLTKAKKPSYEMEACFGEYGMKKSCGQFARNYKIEELVEKQILALTNLNSVRIAGVKSEYLTLGFADEYDDGQAIPITPMDKIEENGLNFEFNINDQREIISYDIFESLEVKSATVIDILTFNETLNSYLVVNFGDNIFDIALIPGKLLNLNKEQYLNIQIPVITNVVLPNTNNYEIKDVKLLAITLPVDKNRNFFTLAKIDKRVRNNLDMF